ncbi:MBL fold metallo-hydrolase [Alkalihalobacterium alkalinitrilicum]|uniref:MBL fold metallo-hydrolase n=1 Tax=Alkalihalobacterium alkalinitrilicum TaxID=427920 RepID=UPI0009951052|nr:MBL fold metallo-hydrolase [Alkalihalobacterium alkalinitrilicum]
MHSIEKIGKKFWYITPISETDRPVLGIVVGNNKTLLIDTGNSEDHIQYFLDKLSKRQVPYPDIVVITHCHWDHIFGLAALSKTVSISSEKTRKEMEKLIHLSWSDEALDERVKEGTEIEFCANAIKKEFTDHRDITITLPDLVFENKVEIDLGGVTCIVQHVGGDHASDSSIVYIKEEKILFLGDCLYANIFSEKENYTIQGTLELLDKLERFETDTYILSHSKQISKEEFNQQITMIRTIAGYTDRFGGDAQKVIKEYRKQVGRDLTEDEMATVVYFVNGY